MLTYPLQVFFTKINISLTTYVMLINILIYFYLIYKKVILQVNKDVFLLLLMLIVTYMLSILINIHYFKIYNFYILTKYISYTVWLIIVYSLKNYLNINENKKVFSGVLLSLGFLNFIAAFSQTIFHRIPEYIDLKPWNLVGEALRAGALYTDSNFLAMYFVILFYTILLVVKNMLVIRNFILLLLFISLLFTFSRGALVFFLISFSYFLFHYMKNYIQKITFILLLLIFFIISYHIIIADNFSIFERFTSKIGDNAAYARIRQYNYLLEHIINHQSSFFFGLGPGVFQNLYFEEVHNFFLSLLSEIGIFGPLILFCLIIIFYQKNKFIEIKALFLFWLFEASTLPALPNSLFILFILVVVTNNYNLIKA